MVRKPSVHSTSSTSNPASVSARIGADKYTPAYALTESAFRKDFREGVSDVKFSPQADRLAAGSNDDSIIIYACDLAGQDLAHGGGPLKMKKTKTNPDCALRLRPLQRLRGHSSYVTHLDWSRDGDLLRSTCGAYELLYWNTNSGKQHTAMPTSDLKWRSDCCPLGFEMMGIWPAYSDGTDINAVHVDVMDAIRSSGEVKIVATGGDDSLVSIMHYPCVVKNAPRKTYTGHGSHVTNVRWFQSPEQESEIGSVKSLASTGGRDASLILWTAVHEISSPRTRKYTDAL